MLKKFLVLFFVIFFPLFLFAENEMEEADKLFSESKFSLAEKAYTQFLKDKPLADAYRKRANCFEQMGQYDKALSDYDNAVKADRTCFDAYYDKALLLYNTLKRKEDSMQALEAAVKVGYSKKKDREPLVKIHVMRSYIHKGQNDLESAVKDLTHALYYTSDPVYFMLRGELRKDLGQYSLAEIDFKKALSFLKEGDEESEELIETIRDQLEECREEIKNQKVPEVLPEPEVAKENLEALEQGPAEE